MQVGARDLTTADLSLAFSTLEQEAVVDELEVSGELPAWLSGSLLRTGPAKFETDAGELRHWFDGLAMLHRFTIDRGSISYGNRFLEGRSYRAARASGRIEYSEFATDPCRSLFKRVQTLFSPVSGLSDNGNVNVARLGDRYLALTETPLPVQFDPQTLEAAGVLPYRTPGELTTAHPHGDQDSGAMINYAAKIGPRSSYRFFTVDPATGETRVIGSVPVREPAYMHSFGLTERWLVLAEFPLLVNPARLATGGRPYIENYRWKPERGTRFTLVDRRTGASTGPFLAETCFAFHHVNAFEQQDGTVVADVCAYPDAGIIEDLYLERLRAGKPIATASLMRFTLDPSDLSASAVRIGETDLELPRINYGRCNGRPYHHVWGNAGGDGGWLERIVKIDVPDGATLSHSIPGCYPGEPVFVARPGAEREDDGVLLSLVLDPAAQSSFLLVLDAGDLSELARAGVPHHIPAGFHGQFMRA